LSISTTFYEQICANILAPKKLQSQAVSREKLRKTFSYKKVMSKMLMKLTPYSPIPLFARKSSYYFFFTLKKFIF